VTNGVSAIAQAKYNASSMVVIGGRAPEFRWGSGALQELDHPALLGPITKKAATLRRLEEIYAGVDEAFTLAATAHRGPVFVDIPMDVFFAQGEVAVSDSMAGAGAGAKTARAREPNETDLDQIADLLARAKRPVLVIGTDVWADFAESQTLELADSIDIPVIANGMGRGVLPPSNPNLVTLARGFAFANADVVLVMGAPLDFRLNYGSFGGKGGKPPAQVIHVTDAASEVATHAELAGRVSGSLAVIANALRERVVKKLGSVSVAGQNWRAWRDELREIHLAAKAKDAADLSGTSTPAHPARIYGELLPRLRDHSVVIGDGGDFVSFAGRYIEPARPGNWLDPGPFGCLGTACGYSMAARLARPGSQVVALLGDGALGFSLGDLESLTRHKLAVVMVMANNGIWALERGPMRKLYGYDVVAELRPEIGYHQVMQALDGAGEIVSDPEQIGSALDRAFESDRPYLVNVITDPDIEYPRSTLGI
jgi:acetolactate synthase-1/2/3 large subunit